MIKKMMYLANKSDTISQLTNKLIKKFKELDSNLKIKDQSGIYIFSEE